MPVVEELVSEIAVLNSSVPDLFQESGNPARQGGDEAVERSAEGAQVGKFRRGVAEVYQTPG